MPNLTDLIAALNQATIQLKQAALTDDWALAERIQKRRAWLVTQIAANPALTLAQQQALRAVREQEAVIVARATTHQRALAHSLNGQPASAHSKTVLRMLQAYHPDPH